MQSFGRLASFNRVEESRLTGHMYSNKLNRPVIYSKLPIQPCAIPVRVLVVLPLATDASTEARVKMATLKEDYIIQRDKIAAALAFFRSSGNKLMDSIEIDEHALAHFPNNNVSVEMFNATLTSLSALNINLIKLIFNLCGKPR